MPDFPGGLPVAPIPRISLASLLAEDAGESNRLWDACCEQGFFLLDLTKDESGAEVLHDVEKAFQTGQEFFALDLHDKEEYKLNPGNIGYKPLGMMKLKNGRTDLTEICGISRDSILGSDNMPIPQVYQRERPQLQKTVNHLHSVAMLLLKVLSAHLDIPFSSLETFHQLESPSSTVLRFLHYPPQKTTSVNEERQQSLLGHTDNGSLTILFANIGGLQILPVGADDNDESAWQWVRPEPGCAIINIGDSLVQLTGGVLASAFHRVLYAPGPQAGEDRFSFGYFLKPANNTPMTRLQVGKVIPQLKESDRDEEVVQYQMWHQNKTKKVMQGHQDGVARGGTAHPANRTTVAA